MDPQLTVIMPCAGSGSRFGAPYPKELHRIGPNSSVVDLALAPLVSLAKKQDLQVRLVVVVAPNRGGLVNYLASYSDLLQVVLTYQDSTQPGLSGAISAALPFCTGALLLLLPDQVVDSPDGDVAIAGAIEQVKSDSIAVVASMIADLNRLRVEGALRLDGEGPRRTIVAAADKPDDPRSYNAAWVHLVVGPKSLDLLPQIVTPGGAQSLVGRRAYLVDRYRNINTPSEGNELALHDREV